MQKKTLIVITPREILTEAIRSMLGNEPVVVKGFRTISGASNLLTGSFEGAVLVDGQNYDEAYRAVLEVGKRYRAVFVYQRLSIRDYQALASVGLFTIIQESAPLENWKGVLLDTLSTSDRLGNNFELDLTCRLTPRESEIALLVARGYSNRMIATTCNISVGTVKVHITHIFD